MSNLKEFRISPSRNKTIAFHWQAVVDDEQELIWVPELWVDIMYICSFTGKTVTLIRFPGTKAFTTNFGQCKIFGTRIHLGSYGNNVISVHLIKKFLNNVKSFSNYKKLMEGYLNRSSQLTHKTIISKRQVRRYSKELYGMSRTGINKMIEIHNFLHESCGSNPNLSHISHNLNYDKYYDQPHFIRHFKKYIGMTPSKFFSAFGGLPEQLMTISYKYQSYKPATITTY